MRSLHPNARRPVYIFGMPKVFSATKCTSGTSIKITLDGKAIRIDLHILLISYSLYKPLFYNLSIINWIRSQFQIYLTNFCLLQVPAFHKFQLKENFKRRGFYSFYFLLGKTRLLVFLYYKSVLSFSHVLSYIRFSSSIINMQIIL